MELRNTISLLYFALSMSIQSQTINFGAQTTFSLGSGTSFFAGGDTDFTGQLINQGTIISYSDLSFFNNRNIGSLNFVGPGIQTIYGDTLFVTNFVVNKSGKVQIQTNQIFVSGNLDVTNGVVETNDIDDLIVTGASNEDGTGYVLGKLVGLTAGQPVTFPMGIEIGNTGFPNYITFSNTTPGITMTVDCVASPDSLFASEEMVGIAEQLEWVVRTVRDSTQATVAVNFSGLDFVNFSNGQPINAQVYAPSIVVFQAADTIFQLLESVEATPENQNSIQTRGRVVSATPIWINTDPTRVAVAWIPVVDGPEFYVPNVFSPEGFYGENRVFRPFFVGGEVTSISMSVYNAYNAEIYRYSESGSNLDITLIGWDGNLNSGQPAEEGVYYYTIRLIADGEAYQQTSSVLLVK